MGVQAPIMGGFWRRFQATHHPGCREVPVKSKVTGTSSPPKGRETLKTEKGGKPEEKDSWNTLQPPTRGGKGKKNNSGDAATCRSPFETG